MIFKWLKEMGIKYEYTKGVFKSTGIIDVKGSYEDIDRLKRKLDDNGYHNDAMELLHKVNPDAFIVGNFNRMFICHDEANADNKGYLFANT